MKKEIEKISKMSLGLFGNEIIENSSNNHCRFIFQLLMRGHS